VVDRIGFTFEAISAAEHDRLQSLYGPLTQAVRNLIEAGIRTGADENTIRDAQAAIDRVTQTLEVTADDRSPWVRHALNGRPVVWGNPVTGWRNAIAPPLTAHRDAKGLWWSEFVLGEAYQGPPGLVHGGICALVLDQILGEAASEGLTKPLFTGTITLRYLRGTPLGPLRAEAAIERTDGIKTFVSGHLSDAEGRTVDAEGIFIKPVWARDAG
jgi:acyl-coenzyme A thioesterase PaaI-like protein